MAAKELNFDIKVEIAPGTESAIDWAKYLRDIPVFPLDAQRQWNRTPMRPRSDIEDAATYLAMGNPRLLGMDFARGHDKSIVHTVMYDHFRRGKYGMAPMFIFHDEINCPISVTLTNPTERPPMQDQTTPTKQFVTHDVPGFQDGHPMTLRREFHPGYDETKNSEFLAYRDAENGVKITATIPATPEAFSAHVRVKPVKPPKVEKKAA